MEGDGRHPLTRLRDRRHFYPRPPGGGRPRVRLSLRRRSTFLSTPSGWRATGLVVLIPAHAVDFYPRPPGGGRPPLFSHSPCNTPISIHALRVEGDSLLRRFSKAVLQFLSTPSGWRATARAQRFGRIFCISIHALRVEGDRRRFSGSIKDNPFLSTPSGWRATGDHAVLQRGSVDFYPRPPGGGRPAIVRSPIPDFPISIHALRVEGDSKNGQSFHLFLRKREKNLPL